MSRARKKDRVQVVFLDEAVHMDVDEGKARSSIPNGREGDF